MHENYKKFIEWAKRYDTTGLEIRSKKRHEKWLKKAGKPLLRIEGDIDIFEKIELADTFIKEKLLQ